MDEILDNEQFEETKNDNLTSNIKLKAGIYSTIMLLGGMVYIVIIANYKPTFYNVLMGTIIVNFSFLLLGTTIVLLRLFFRKLKDKKESIITKYDPIWYQIVEVSFVWWIFCMFFIFVGKVV